MGGNFTLLPRRCARSAAAFLVVLGWGGRGEGWWTPKVVSVEGEWVVELFARRCTRSATAFLVVLGWVGGLPKGPCPPLAYPKPTLGPLP